VVRYHKHTRQYYVWDGAAKRRVYLGTDRAVAEARHAEMTADRPPEPPPPGGLSVNELLLAYLGRRKADGTDPRDLGLLKAAIRFASAECGTERAAGFRAKLLQRVRTRMLQATDRRRPGVPLSRHYVNKLVKQLVAAWQWAAAEESVPAETALSLRTVKALRLGKGGREVPPVPAVEPWAVEATLPHLREPVRTMVLLQLLAGMRPGEVCALRRRDVSTSPREPVPLPGTGRSVAALECGGTAVWVAVPYSHKGLWRGKPRAVCLGPRARAVLSPWLDVEGTPTCSARAGRRGRRSPARPTGSASPRPSGGPTASAAGWTRRSRWSPTGGRTSYGTRPPARPRRRPTAATQRPSSATPGWTRLTSMSNKKWPRRRASRPRSADRGIPNIFGYSH
jgi:integrase